MLSHPLAKYNKAIVAVVGLAVTVAGSLFGDAAWFAPLVALLSALGVYNTPNA